MATELILRPKLSPGRYHLGAPMSGFIPEEILYHRLQVTVATGACSYLEGSGSYTDYYSVAEFIETLQAGDDLGPYSSLPNPDIVPSTPPSVVIRAACGIVVDLSSDDQSSLQFDAAHPSIMTADDHHLDYRWLNAYNDETGKCSLISFIAPHPRQSGDDPFAIYLKYGSGSGQVPYPIDPAIKNRGGSGLALTSDDTRRGGRSRK